MQLSDLLRRCCEEFPHFGMTGDAEHEARVRVNFANALRAAQRHAEGLEQALRMLEARQIPSIHADALQVALSTGKVSILPVHRTLTAHNLDGRRDDEGTPGPRLGEDEPGWIA